MSVRIQDVGDTLAAYLQGELDHHAAKGIREQIDAAIDAHKPQKLVLDFKDVTFMDSSGIGLVMGRYKAMQAVGGEVYVENTTAHIKKVMKLAGLDRIALIDGLK